MLLQSTRFIRTDELAELLWDDPPASATANIRSHVTGLRSDLDQAEPGLHRRLQTLRGGQAGYRLQVRPEEFDLPAFTAAARRGRTAWLGGDLDTAVDSLEAAVGLWRGSFGQGLPQTRWFTAHTAGLNNARLDACQDLFTVYLLTGRNEMLTYQIESALTEGPYRQRLWELLAAAHCINGDIASALAVIERCRAVFAGDLGLDLPPDVLAVQLAALNWDGDEIRRIISPGVNVRG